MSKFRSLILIIGLIIIAVAAALLTVLVLYATGTIVTDPIELVYSVDSAVKYYDGTPLTLDENAYILESGEILEGHTAKVRVIGSQTNAGESESTLEVKIFDKKGFDVSGEYAVKVNVGTLTVERQKLSVSIPNSSVLYSGKRVYFNDYEINDGSLAKGHKIAGVNASLLNVGDPVPDDISPVIYDAFDNDVSTNYEILDFELGTIEILPRPLTIKPQDVSKVYDGTALTATEYEIVSGSLAPGQTVKYTIVTTADGEATFVDCTDEFGVRIKFGEFNIFDEDGDKVDLNNYECFTEAGILKIEKRPITFATATQVFTYDGDGHFDDTVRIFSGTLAPNQLIAVKGVTTVTEVADGEVSNELDCAITLKDGTRVDGNYSITYINGTLSVAPCSLTVYTKSYTKVYDGKPLGDLIDGDSTNYELKSDLAAKFTLTAGYDATVKDRVDVIAETTYTLTDVAVSLSSEDGDKDCTENFKITVKEGKYSITKKPATIQSPSATFTYDGTEHYIDDKSKCIVNGLISGHEFEMTSYTKVTNVTDSGLNVIGYNILSDTEDVKNNYDITISYGTLTVGKRPLTVQSGSKSFEYDGADHTYTEGYKTVGLLSTHTFTVTDSTAVKDVEGDVPNVFEYTITESGADVMENYEISFVAGRLTVIQKAVTVTTEDGTRVYNGEAFSKAGGTPVGLLAGHNLSPVGAAPSITDVGTATNEQLFNIIDSAGAPVTNNYKISYVYGTLEVTPDTKDIYLNTATAKEYDGIAYTATEVAAQAFNGVTLPAGVTADGFNIISLSEIKNAGTYYYTAEYTGDNKNYIFNIHAGSITVNKKAVTLSYGGAPLAMTYSGLHSYYSDDAQIIAGLTVGIGAVHSAVLSKTLTSIAVGSVTVYNGGEDITSNLTITGNVNVPVTVNKCAFSLVLMPYSTSYYVKPEDLPACVRPEGLCGGDKLVIEKEEIFNDGYSYYQVLSYKIVSPDGDNVTGYYTDADLSGRGNITVIF